MKEGCDAGVTSGLQPIYGGLARQKNKHKAAARADRLMWGINLLVEIVE